MTTDQSSIGAQLLARLPLSADAYPHKIDLVRGAVLVIELDAAAYRAASFLDDRILGPASRGTWLPGGRVTEAARQIRELRPLHFIFHTGHVGSTLLSRLLDDTGSILSLREPIPLRTLAEAADVLGQPDSLFSEEQFASLLDMMLRLWGRGYDWSDAVVVKATSSAGRLARPILGARPAARAIYLNVRAETYLATLLAGESSPIDLRGHGPERVRRLRASTAASLAPLHALSPGEQAALAWLVETRSQLDAVRSFPDRVMGVDFDELLDEVVPTMARILGHLGVSAESGFLDRIVKSPTLTHYSKAPEHGYTPEFRNALLRESRANNATEILRGMAWLERFARADESVAQLLEIDGN